jgi:UDP-N-acetylmuramate dehydrogenase
MSRSVTSAPSRTRVRRVPEETAIASHDRDGSGGTKRRLLSELPGLRRELSGVREAVPLAPYCAYGVGGPAELLFEATTTAELRSAVVAGRQSGLPVTVLGQATNVLIADRGLPGLVVLARNAALDVRDEVLTCDAGAVLSPVVTSLAERGLAGLEFAGNIPGSVGGAVVGNAGAYGRAVADALVSAELLVGEQIRSFTPADLRMGYRTSLLKDPGGAGRAGVLGGAYEHSGAECDGRHDADPTAAPSAGHERAGRGPDDLAGACVLRAVFSLASGSSSALLAEIARDAELRRSKHPLEYASCGSYFRNPSSDRPAALLIEQAGLKGLRVGLAEVSRRHANFLVALKGAAAADILALAEEVKRRVFEQSGVRLVEEVVHLGFGAEA